MEGSIRGMVSTSGMDAHDARQDDDNDFQGRELAFGRRIACQLSGLLVWMVKVMKAAASGDSSDTPCDAACIPTGTLSGSRGTHPSINGPG